MTGRRVAAVLQHPEFPPPEFRISADPWFQALFADRIGGANFGKDTDPAMFTLPLETNATPGR